MSIFYILIIIIALVIFRPMMSGRPISEGIFGMEVKGGSAFMAVVLFCTLLALGQRVLYDIARLIGTGGNDYIFQNYINDFPTLIGHTFFAALLLVVCFILSTMVSEKKKKYAVIMLPYFFLAIFIMLQILGEIGIYFFYHHTQVQFYIVMVCLVALSSIAIYGIQRTYTPLLDDTN